MIVPSPLIQHLTEFQPRSLPADALSPSDGELLWAAHRDRVEVEFPSPKSGGDWRLVPRGWIGYLPVSPTLALRIAPKVPLRNVFRMLEVAYDLKGFEFFDDLVDSDSIDDFYERLAHVLAVRVLTRLRRGLHREYRGRNEDVVHLRGRLEIPGAVRRPWSPRLPCHFEEHTAETEDNRILAWTLERIVRSGLCRKPEVSRAVRRASRGMQAVRVERVAASACTGRLYSRLNDDYRPLHALCRFFLEHTGPTHGAGDSSALGFLVDMASLFELFVARWLAAHVTGRFTVEPQHRSTFAGGRLSFVMDLVIHDREKRPIAVLDTKYKRPETLSTGDVAQVIAYAEALGCREAILVYPATPEPPLEVRVGQIRVRTLAFDLGQELDREGRKLLDALRLPPPPPIP